MPIISTPKVNIANTNRFGKVIPTGLITHYDLQNTASYGGTGTTVTSLTRSATNGTIVGPTSYGTVTSTNYIEFNGTNVALEYIRTPDLNSFLYPNSTSTQISVFMWVYLIGNGSLVSEQGTLPNPDSGWFDTQIELVGGTLKFAVWPYSAGSITSSIATPLNDWHYVGFTYNGTTLIAYVNGTPAGSLSVARESPGNNGRLLYYCVGHGSSTNLNGVGAAQGQYRLGAFHVYNRGLSATEVSYNWYVTKSKYSIVIPLNATTSMDATGATAIPTVAGQDDAFGPIPTISGFSFLFFGTDYGNNTSNGIYWNTNNVIGFGPGVNAITWSATTGRGILLGNVDRRTNTAFYFPIQTVESYKILRCLMSFQNFYSDGIPNAGQLAVRFVRGPSLQYIEVRIFKGRPSINGGGVGTAGNWNITNGSTFQNTFSGTTFNSLFPEGNTSFVLTSDLSGNAWTVTSPAYLNI
jgi:hypothetical protein